MKKVTLIFLFMLLLIGSNKAQINIGLMGGINFSDAKQQQLFFTKAKSRTQFALGGVIDYQFAKNFGVRLEPLYIEKGTYGKLNKIEKISAKISLNLSYIEFPILFKYSVGDVVQPYMFAGPTIGFKLDSDIMLHVGALELGIDADDIVKNFECSFNLGGGINYKIDELATIFFEARYVFGLTDIIKKGNFNLRIANEVEHGNMPDQSNYDNRGFQIMVGFTFPLTIN